MDKLTQEFNKQRDLLRWLDQRFKIPFKTDQRSRAYLSCYDLAIEHHAAILLLFEAGLRGSMFALFRVQFESLVRGQYLHYCASEQDWELFFKDKDMTKKFGPMIVAVEKKIDETHQVLSNLKNNAYTIFNSFTHTGHQHLVRRNTENNVGAVNYPDEEVLQGLKMSGSLALLAFAGMAGMTDDENIQDELLVKIKEYSVA